jgi:4a-hydroxytetrahydrobiopterin dehydratase
VYPVASHIEAVALASVAAEAAGSNSALAVDLRASRVRVSVGGDGGVDETTVTLLDAVATAIQRAGWTPAPPTSARFHRPVSSLEVCIDTSDPDRIRPFWRAALAFDEGEDGSLIDPADQLPSIWFQTMDEPRTARNRIHLDLTVAHDEAEARIAAVIAAGGRRGETSLPPSFTVLIDPDGNEVCICTWTGRDERGW